MQKNNHYHGTSSKRESIFSDRIPERRHSETNLFCKNNLFDKQLRKRVSEPNISQSFTEPHKTKINFFLYNKKDYRTWLIKNHPIKRGEFQVFQMYRPISFPFLGTICI